MTLKLKSRTPWRHKLEHPNVPLPKIVSLPVKWRARFGTGTMAIAHPLDVDALIRTVPRGCIVTQAQLRALLAKKYRADHVCPLTTGIFVRIAAEAAEEDRRAGKRSVTPWWRVVRDNGSLNEKLPGGPAAQARMLRAEGFRVERGPGKQPRRVRDFEKFLARL
jgi:hypothetical protein